MDGLRRRHPREQGDLGERAAVEWLWRAGAYVFIPFGHSPDYDLVADIDGRALRVQVKTSTCRRGQGFVVQLCTNGGNQSWTGVVKYFSPNRCDVLFVLVEGGRRWLIPSPAIEARRSIVVGGPKFAEFEVSDEHAATAAQRLLEWSDDPRGDVRVVKGDAL